MKLDDWTDEQVDSLIDGGGNAAVNARYEAFLPDNIIKPKPDSSIDERSEFIRSASWNCQIMHTSDIVLNPYHIS